MFNLQTATVLAVALSITATSAFAEKVLRIQSVLCKHRLTKLVMLGAVWRQDVADSNRWIFENRNTTSRCHCWSTRYHGRS